MVKSVDSPPVTPRLLEIVGPAGAGKTTLAAMLCRQSGRIQSISSLKRKRHAPYYLGSAAAVAPIMAHSIWSGAWSGWQATYWMVRLGASESVLSRELRGSTAIGLIDQGPIYTLARLSANPELQRDRQLRAWWNRSLSYWAHRLHCVVWLDAAAEVLADRVDARAKAHAFKGQPREIALCRLEEHRRLYSETMELLSSCAAPRILHYDTAQDSLETIAAGLLQLLNLTTENYEQIK